MNGYRQPIASFKIFHFVFVVAKRRLFSTRNRHTDGGRGRSALDAVPEDKRHRSSTSDNKLVSDFSSLIFPDRAHTRVVYFELRLFLYKSLR
jgi:hypothetical protein